MIGILYILLGLGIIAAVLLGSGAIRARISFTDEDNRATTVSLGRFLWELVRGKVRHLTATLRDQSTGEETVLFDRKPKDQDDEPQNPGSG
jgi:hypothetical protein